VKASKKHGIVKGSKKTYLKVKKKKLGPSTDGTVSEVRTQNHFRKIHTKSDQFQVHVH